MKNAAPGKIYLADHHATFQSSHFQRTEIFHGGLRGVPAREPLAQLIVWNDEQLAAQSFSTFELKEKGYLLIIPVTGLLSCLSPEGTTRIVGPGESLLFPGGAPGAYTFTNFEENQYIRYLLIVLAYPEVNSSPAKLNVYSPLDRWNEWLPVAQVKDAFRLEVSLFSGRSENFQEPGPQAHFFCYALSGAFEVDGRLLHPGDGLALWHTDRVEIEALSHQALLFSLQFYKSI